MNDIVLDPMNKTTTIFETCYGWIGLEKSAFGISRSTLPMYSYESCRRVLNEFGSTSNRDDKAFVELKSQLKSYFSGSIVNFDDVELDTDSCTPFFRKAWQVCRDIPYGETRTYKWIAEKSGHPNAARAAGQAMAKNRFPILVPCHRVLGSNGRLTGYGNGTKQLSLKAALIQIEQVH